MSLADRKKARANRKASLRSKVEKEKSNTSYNDPRIWSCARNKAGQGQAVIRFLEPTDADIKFHVEQYGLDANEVPFYIGKHEHGFKGPNGKWFIENCPTSAPHLEDGKCPVCEANGEIVDGFGGWEAVDDNHPGKKLVRNRKRKEQFYANVLIIEDKANPENEGKVKIFKYGKAIQDMIMSQLIPEFEDEEDCDVSDYWEGRNFKLKIVKKDGYTNYDKSSWGDVGPVSDDDDEIDEILKKQHVLSEFVAEDKYKSYEELEKAFAKTQGTNTRTERSIEDEDGGAGDTGEDEESKPVSKTRRSRSKPEPDPEPSEDNSDSASDDDDEYFASLLDD